MICRANLPEQLWTVTATSPCPPISSPTTTHNAHLEFLTLSLALHRTPRTSATSELHVYRQSMNWSKLYSRFSRSFCRAFHMHTVPSHDNSYSGDPLQTSPRTYSFSCSTVVSHWQGRICLGLCSQSSTDLSISEQVLLWQSSIFSLSLRIWASCLVSDWKGNIFWFLINFTLEIIWTILWCFFRSSLCLPTK